MQYKDQIRDLAIMVNEGLSIYLVVHNKIFKESGTFRSFLRNLFGRGTPMSLLLEETESLMPIWNGIHQKIEEFKSANYSVLMKDEKSYFDVLSRYVDAIKRTLAALIDRQRLLAEGSEELRNNHMTWKVFKQKERVYLDSIEEYSKLGNELNSLAAIIFNVK